MPRKLLLLSFVLALFALAAAAQDLTADQVIAKSIQARGGMEKLKAVKSLRMTGKMLVGPGMEAPVTMELKRPASFRMEFTFQGLTGVQAYDGKTGWRVMPFQGKKDPEPMGEEEVKLAAEQADMDGPLVDYKDKGNTVELLGKESVEGAPAYKLKVTLKNGGIRTIYFDADSFLELKTESKVTLRGTEREGESSLGDYKEVDGLMFAYSIEASQKGSPMKQKITLDKIEVNPAIEDARFKMPEVKKEEPPKTPAASDVKKEEPKKP